MLYRMGGFAEHLRHREFYKQVDADTEVGLLRCWDKFAARQSGEHLFVLYENI